MIPLKKGAGWKARSPSFQEPVLPLTDRPNIIACPSPFFQSLPASPGGAYYFQIKVPYFGGGVKALGNKDWSSLAEKFSGNPSWVQGADSYGFPMSSSCSMTTMLALSMPDKAVRASTSLIPQDFVTAATPKQWISLWGKTVPESRAVRQGASFPFIIPLAETALFVT